MRYIFDLDHTVIDSSHRQATRPDGSLDLEHWKANSTRQLIAVSYTHLTLPTKRIV